MPTPSASSPSSLLLQLKPPALPLEGATFQAVFGEKLQKELDHYLTYVPASSACRWHVYFCFAWQPPHRSTHPPHNPTTDHPHRTRRYGRNVSAQYWADTLRKEMARAVWMAQALGAPHDPLESAEDLARVLSTGRAVVTQVRGGRLLVQPALTKAPSDSNALPMSSQSSPAAVSHGKGRCVPGDGALLRGLHPPAARGDQHPARGRRAQGTNTHACTQKTRTALSSP